MDLQLGATHLWNNTVWTGNNILTTPKDLKTTTHLLRWGLACAQYGPSTPFILFTLLHNTPGAHTPWTHHPYFVHLATLPPQLCATNSAVNTTLDLTLTPYGHRGASLISFVMQQAGSFTKSGNKASTQI